MWKLRQWTPVTRIMSKWAKKNTVVMTSLESVIVAPPTGIGGGSSRSHRLCKLDKLLLRVKTKAGWNTDTHLKCQRATQLVENYQVKVQERKMVLMSVGAAESGPCPRGVTAGDCSKPHPTFMGNLNAGPSEWGWSGETILAKTAAWPCYLGDSPQNHKP